MKKTILTLAMGILLVGNALWAKESFSENSINIEESFTEYAINSFCKAVMQGDFDTVKRMIELGEDIDQKSLGMTPVMFAARYNKADVLQLLIDNGADLKIKSNQGFSVTKYAELSKATDALAVLENAMGS